MYFQDRNSHFSLISISVFGVLSLYKFSQLAKQKEKYLLDFLTLLVYFFRSCDIFLNWHNDGYPNYSLPFETAIYSVDSLIVCMVIVNQALKQTGTKKSMIEELKDFTKNLKSHKKAFRYLVTWNISLYALSGLKQNFDCQIFTRVYSSFIVASWWILAYQFHTLATKLKYFKIENLGDKQSDVISAEAQIDIALVSLIMMGGLNFISSMFGEYLSKYTLSIQSNSYLFEILFTILVPNQPIASIITSFNPHAQLTAV